MTTIEFLDRLKSLPERVLDKEISITLYRRGQQQILRQKSSIQAFYPVVSGKNVNLEISVY